MTYLFIIVNVSIISGKILEINLAIIAGLINFIRIYIFQCVIEIWSKNLVVICYIILILWIRINHIGHIVYT